MVGMQRSVMARNSCTSCGQVVETRSTRQAGPTPMPLRPIAESRWGR